MTNLHGPACKLKAIQLIQGFLCILSIVELWRNNAVE
jgi:hypothetical protein